jgi:hypothetical protein
MIAVGFWLVILTLWLTHNIGMTWAVTLVLYWMVGHAVGDYILFCIAKKGR